MSINLKESAMGKLIIGLIIGGAWTLYHILTEPVRRDRAKGPYGRNARGDYGHRTILPSGRRVGDYLVSQDFPNFKTEFRLNKKEMQNLLMLDEAVAVIDRNMGRKGIITSGGRPQRYADFVTVLREREKLAPGEKSKIASRSKHNDFRAVDLDYGSPISHKEIVTRRVRVRVIPYKTHDHVHIVKVRSKTERPTGRKILTS
jgi:hypothetical protein